MKILIVMASIIAFGYILLRKTRRLGQFFAEFTTPYGMAVPAEYTSTQAAENIASTGIYAADTMSADFSEIMQPVDINNTATAKNKSPYFLLTSA
jgi:hypothetical protein